ncbi:beta-ketoacyl synthase N-terminal-like domain-containing protein [Actinokineospora sp.]|uniref:beta-ketoacyl synthase N-terminal-like domain-containing protein n=1 Tax=Actinokineospora sp. TaxID=1872133 RepID=UPI003D6BE7CD
MSADSIAVTGWSVVSGTAFGTAEFTAAVQSGGSGPVAVDEMFDEPLPVGKAYAMPTFSAREHLGRKGSSSLDRTTALAAVGCGQALADASVTVDEESRRRFGIVLGTTAGSVRATSEFSRATVVEDKPYHVNPVLFPTAVMNCAAGHSAIRYGLKGVNATVAGGQLAGVQCLRYARNLIGRGYADAVLVGAAEEFSPHTAWADHLRWGGQGVPQGEGAVVFVTERTSEVRAAGRTPEAEVLAAQVGTVLPGASAAEALAGCVGHALSQAGVRADEVWAVSTGERGIPERDEPESASVDAVFGARAKRVRVKELVGECHAASGAFQVAALLAAHRADAGLDGRVSVVTGVTSDGAVGAVVLRGWRRASGDHGV